MNENRHSLLIDWGFRLLIAMLAILWFVYPPKGAEPFNVEPFGVETIGAKADARLSPVIEHLP